MKAWEADPISWMYHSKNAGACVFDHSLLPDCFGAEGNDCISNEVKCGLDTPE